MNVKFGNLERPRHSIDPTKPESESKVIEMMDKLHEAGFVRQQNVQNELKEWEYHVYSLPYQIEFGGHGYEAISIIEPYSNYLQPISLVSPEDKK